MIRRCMVQLVVTPLSMDNQSASVLDYFAVHGGIADPPDLDGTFTGNRVPALIVVRPRLFRIE